MKFDYNKKYKQNNTKQQEEIKQPIIEEPVIEEPVIEEVIKNEEKDEHKTDDMISEHINEEKYGIVVNCDLLNVRREPNATSTILTVINADQKIKILDELDEFYRVLIDDPINSYEGYCMKKFIKIN